MKKFILSGVVFFGLQLFAQDRVDLIQNQILFPSKDVQAFDGRKFGDLTDAQLREKLKATYGQADLNSKDQTLKVSNDRVQYKLEWKNQDFEKGLDLRMNQAIYLKKKNELMVRSTSFNGKYIRSATICEGSMKNEGVVDKEVFCATATKEVCKEVLAAYRKNDTLRTPGVSAQKSKEITDAKVEACMETMKGYSEVLSAFHKRYTGNEGVWNNHKKMLKQEEKEVSGMLSGVEGGSMLRKNFVNNLEGDDFASAAHRLTSSMTGLNQINNFIDICNANEGNFAPDEVAAAAAPSAGAASSNKR